MSLHKLKGLWIRLASLRCQAILCKQVQFVLQFYSTSHALHQTNVGTSFLFTALSGSMLAFIVECSLVELLSLL